CSLVIGAVADAVAEGYRLNQPVRRLSGAGTVAPLVEIEPGAIVLETVKQAYDRSGDLILRLYESRGGRAQATLRSDVDLADVRVTDLLERAVADQGVATVVGPREARLTLRPFQLVTLRASLTRT